MIVIIFRSRIREENAEAFQLLADQLYDIASALPGFVSYKVFKNDDGERVSIHEWESADHLRAWREHPVHQAAQKMGREMFYESYILQVCESPRESRFPL